MSNSEVDGKTEPGQRKSVFERLVGESLTIAFTTGLLFLLGYIFLDAKMGVFGIDLWAIDFPSYAPLVVSLTPVRDALRFSLLGFTYFVFLVTFLAILIPRVRDWANREPKSILSKWFNSLFVWLSRQQASTSDPSFFEPVLVSRKVMIERILIPGLIVALGLLALSIMILTDVNLGIKAATQQYDNGAYVHLVFGSNTLSSLEPKLARANDGGKLRLLTQTKDLVVVFEKTKSHLDQTESVFVLKRADLLSVRLWNPGDKHDSSR